MHVLVTGGAGYIGSHACKALAEAGHVPVAFDNLSCGHRRAVRWGPFEQGDINDSERLDAVLARYQPGAVMHFAACAYVGESVREPAKYYRNNVVGTLTLIEAMQRQGIEIIVFSSSCATYGIPASTPIAEDHRQDPVSPYGATKLTVERMLRDFEPACGLRHISLRYFNAAGADPQGEIGEDHDPETHLIPLALQAALGRSERLNVFGDDYPTADGSCVRDYIHVSDLATAHVLALEYLNAGGASMAVNLGIGKGYSVFEVIETACRVTGRPIPIEVVGRRPGDPPVLTADAKKAGALLGWRPRYIELESIVRHAWAWHRKR